MDALLSAHATLEKKGNLSKTITDVQALIDQLQRTRDAVAETPELTAMHIAKLKQPVKASFDKIEEDLKEVNKGLNQYQKALKDKFKNANLPSATALNLDGGEGLVNRAVTMHLLREGKFGVAKTFVREVNERAKLDPSSDGVKGQDNWLHDFADIDTMEMDGDEVREAGEVLEGKGSLQRRFTEMYKILDALRTHHDLSPAIAWARENTLELERRGSNLEFDLSRLRFIELYTSQPSPDNPLSGPLSALQYAQLHFPQFQTRYPREIAHLLGSLPFAPSLPSSPYSTFLLSQSTWNEVAASFTREFCSMLGLASTSPLYTAVTAGGIALPILEKVERVMSASRGQWTSVNEMPVEIPLPPEMLFHSIFVCPVSKEQGTDVNPPMLLECGHVIAKESMVAHARGKLTMKCPYCPRESRIEEAKRLFI